MKPTSAMALAAGLAAVASQAVAQQGRPITQEDVEAAKVLYEQIKGPCATGSARKACGVLVYSPDDCNGKKKDPHIAQVFNSYDDETVRFRAGNTQIVRRPYLALRAPVGMIGQDGITTNYSNPRFVSWEDYQAGKKDVTVCGKSKRVSASDFTLQSAVEKFLKANP